MTKHAKIYFKYFGYGEQDLIPCEICGREAVDIHHILYRSQGGKDTIENLMALCRYCHKKAHMSKVHRQVFQARHEMFMDTIK